MILAKSFSYKRTLSLTLSLLISFLLTQKTFAQNATDVKSTSTTDNIKKFQETSPFWKALELQRQSIEKAYPATDLVVAPQLRLEMTAFKDDRDFLAFIPAVRGEEIFLSAGVSKYFSTGTLIDFTTTATSTEFRNNPGTTNHLGNFQLALTQNLWRDFFGEQDAVRRARNLRDFELRLLQVKSEQANLMVRYEQTLWDYIAAQVELKLREESLKNWIELERWMKGRYQRAAAELVDVKQISATKILREIQVKTVQQSLINLKNDLDQVGGPGFSNYLFFNEKLLKTDISEFSNLTQANSLDAMIQEKTADLSEQEMKSVFEANKPDLKLSVSIGRTGIDDSTRQAWVEAYGTQDFMARASLVLSTPIDFSLLRTSSEAAKLNFEAASLRKTQANQAARLAWANLQGQINEHYNRIKLLKNLTKEQQARNTAEKRRFMNGRSTSLQVVTAEQETLDAELTLRSAQASLKKLISQYRLFDLPNSKLGE